MTLFALTATLLAASPLAPLPVPAPRLAEGAKLVRASPTAVQSLRISLPLRDRPGLDALIQGQRDPASPLFKQWLTPAEFGERFGQTASDYQSVVSTLEAAGLTVRTFHNRMYLEGVGTVGQVEKLVGVRLFDATQNGETFRTFQGTPTLPGKVASLVLAVSGLDTRRRFLHRLYANGTATMGPQDLRRYYDIDSLHSQGYAGQLSSVVVVGSIPDPSVGFSLADVQYFYSAVSDSSATPVVIALPIDGSGTDNQTGLNVEEEMDMEMPTVAAPLMKTVTLVEAPPDNLFIGGFNEVNEHLSNTTAVSTSFGRCEPIEQEVGQGDIDATANAVAQGVAEGIAYFDASGDSGAADCYDGNAQSAVLSVDFPSSIPYLVAVGGSMFAHTATFDSNDAVTSYQQEAVWNEFSAAAGGGGSSILYGRPWYQNAPGTDGGAREVPDISLLADLSPGVAIVDQSPGLVDNDGDGTSDASPMAAGMFALINDFIGGCRLGSPAPELYALGRAQYTGGTAVFHDITSGNNSLDGVTGYTAGVGYDEASGLGSIDVAAMAGAWPLCPPTTPTVDAGTVTFPDGGEELIWNPGAAIDAGTRGAYSACNAIDCDGGSVEPLTCAFYQEGPSLCVETCEAGSANTCGSGQFCFSEDAGAGLCENGCTSNAGCAASDAGPTCLTCANACVEPNNPSGVNGGPCTTNADCVAGGTCLAQNPYGFPGGYCTFPCPTNCGCGTGAICSMTTVGGLCAPSCSVSQGGPCRGGYVCYPQDSSDVGACMPACTAQNQFCTEVAPPNSTCDTTLGGICIPPGVTPPTLTSSSSGSSSSSASSASSSSSSSSSSGQIIFGSTGTSSGASGSTSSSGSNPGASSSGSGASSSAPGSTSSGSGATSNGTSSGSASAGSGSSHASTSTGTTRASTAAAATTSTSGGSSSSGTSSGGCNCTTGAGPDALWGLMAMTSFAMGRRRRRIR